MNPSFDESAAAQPRTAAASDAELLRRRAAALARPPAAPEAPGAMLDVLEFSVANERYALPMAGVDAVLAFEQLTPLPGTPRFMPGIVNVRGRIVAVIDIRAFFDLPERGITDLHQVILVSAPGIEVGLLADTVLGLQRVAIDRLQTSLPTLGGIRSDYLRGVTAEQLIVLDLGRLLADPAIIVDDRAG